MLHVTKTGTYKGSTLLPHAVDANFSLKRDDDDPDLRVLEATKNRFGGCITTTFKMTQHGFSFEPIEETPSEQTTERVSILTVRSNKIVEHVNINGFIDMNTAVALCDDSQQNAYLAIRNCVLEGSLIKKGRGNDAKWVKQEVTT